MIKGLDKKKLHFLELVILFPTIAVTLSFVSNIRNYIIYF